MKCPNCESTLDVDQCVYLNADTYGKTNVITTNCCGEAITVRPIRTYEVRRYEGNRSEDDWGNPIKSSTTNK